MDDMVRRIYEAALMATKKATRWVYLHNFSSGEKSISCREPSDHTIHLTSLMVCDYAEVAGVSQSAARGQLRRLVKEGLMTEDKRCSTCLRFRPGREVAEQIGKELIFDLSTRGIQFEDERVAKMNKKVDAQ